jgi:hypothetical protein
MSELAGQFDPLSPKELINLVPDRCASCRFGQFIVALERIDLSRQGPLQRVKDIGERCTGYEGSDPESEMHSGSFDRSGCPYALLVREDSDIETA